MDQVLRSGQEEVEDQPERSVDRHGEHRGPRRLSTGVKESCKATGAEKLSEIIQVEEKAEKFGPCPNGRLVLSDPAFR
jgi:hypothetical protein